MRLKSGKSAWKDEQRQCVRCSAGFKPSYEPQRYCSRACSMVVRGAEKTKKRTFETYCKWCQKVFSKRLSQKGKTGDFCTVKCGQAFKRGNEEQFITKSCPTCKTEFQTAYRPGDQRQYCSQTCALSNLHVNILRGNKEIARKISAARAREIVAGKRNHPTGHKQGYFISIKNPDPIFYRSSYELKALEILEEDSGVVGIIGEPFSLPYSHKGISKNYIPDFLIQLKNQRQQLIEVKPKSMANTQQNMLKKQAAKKFCKISDMEYVEWTENELGL